ncbi:hypothetical protein H6F75_00505 [Nodosilinea sp. FACHB-131]|uniref:hypothetical protein n=1 Tax=Cyanophyceae TaxID=3028117 RepID=UPI00168778FC|nr:hypothetical protein [Nodosilinea sp. FACHB-131]MBD1871951.1 hypothetical protein [Nodosilinea sp. FACHB-131]
MAYGAAAAIPALGDPILATPDLYWYANANYEIFQSNGGAASGTGNPVGYIITRGSSAINVEQLTSAARPTASLVNAKPSLSYDGGDFFQVGDNNDWNFLHNTNGFTAVLAFKKNLSNPGNVLMTLLDTVGISSANIGLTIFYDNRAVVPAVDRLRIFIGRGVSGEPLQDRQSLDGRLFGTGPHVIVVRFDGSSSLRANVDGTQVIAFDSNNFGVASNGDSTFPLNLARTGSNLFYLTGEMPFKALFNRRLTDTEVEAIEDYWIAELGI